LRCAWSKFGSKQRSLQETLLTSMLQPGRKKCHMHMSFVPLQSSLRKLQFYLETFGIYCAIAELSKVKV
jgi:hypothetical protein